MAASWSDLPLDILALLAKRLPGAEDFVSFGGVCKSWRDAAIHVKKTGRGFSPWMMLSKLENDHSAADAGGGVRTFCDVSTGKFYDIRLPQLQGKRCWGTHYGWLIVFGLRKDIFLFHPLTQAKLCLPSQLKFGPKPDKFRPPINNCKNYIKKIAISSGSGSGPSPMVVMASFGTRRTPAFASPGDKVWTSMTTPASIADIIFFKRYFYAVNGAGELSVFSTVPVPRTKVIVPPPSLEECDGLGKFYLVEISGSLYLINRSYDDPTDDDPEAEDWHRGIMNRKTLCFYAFRLTYRIKKWSLCKHLQGYALFLGNNQSFAISPLDYPHFKPNCVYYTDDFYEHSHSDYLDMGIYDYVNDTILKPFDNCRRLPSSKLSGSVFFMPQLT